MSSIDPAQRLASAMRTQRVRERAAARAGAAVGSEGARRGAHGVSGGMAQRIAAIDAQDPDRPRKAVRIYLEAELAREFGAALLNDPQFPSLLDAVQQRMDEDPQTAGAVEALGRLLLAGKVKPA